jgi:hypothetical protein
VGGVSSQSTAGRARTRSVIHVRRRRRTRTVSFNYLVGPVRHACPRFEASKCKVTRTSRSVRHFPNLGGLGSGRNAVLLLFAE